MKRILILVEGLTEEKFVKSILSPHLEDFGITPIPTIITTKVVKTGKNFKGGFRTYNKIQKELKILLNDREAMAVTTMIDYYALPNDFPWERRPDKSVSCYTKIKLAEENFKSNIDNRKFIPYLQLHEFESILFSSPDAIARPFEGEGKHKQILKELENTVRNFRGPEEINDDPNTCPSKRIVNIVGEYRKPLHGPTIARNIGLNIIRSKCPHFNDWVKKLESLST
ncbi:MAG: DUF4276 family protein [Deltaproteobacteria bacterium]|uniref:DUF4276 family protein n=1 Tax=Candidatus Zymogenus saltonus TaxID=2844893 RepID=A0A9D8PSJ3_9DELT|nr:DUF4276 family protein [Candidatus Zymogenus saltonus]